MSQNNVLAEIDALLQQLAAELATVANRESPGWNSVLLSVRWAGEDGMCDIVVESSRGNEKKYHFATGSSYTLLMRLWTCSRSLQPAWNELLLSVTADGSCQTKFGYE